MKKTGLFILFILMAVWTHAAIHYVPDTLQSQGKEGPEKMIKIKKVITTDEGETIVVDTSFTTRGEMPEDLFEFDGNKIIVKELGEKLGEEMNVMVISDSDGDDLEQKFEVIIGDDDNNMNIMKRYVGDSTLHILEGNAYEYRMESDDGKQVFIVKTSREGDSTSLKHILMEEMEGDGKGLITIEAETDESGEGLQIKIRKEKGDEEVYVIKEKGENGPGIFKKVMIQRPGDNDSQLLKKMDMEDAGMTELELEGLRFYPNPSDGVVTVEFTNPSEEPVMLRVFDNTGKVVFKEKLKPGEGRVKKELNLADQGSGVYFVQITQNKASVLRKIIIE